MSCPSTRSTCQPNARNLASRSPRSLTSCDPGVGLDLVVVDDRGDLVAARRLRRRLQRLPELAFLQLAVAGQHEDRLRRRRRGGWRATMPLALEMPMPSEPVLAWMYGVSTCGWPGQAVQPPQLVDLVAGRAGRARSAPRRAPARRGPWTRRRRRSPRGPCSRSRSSLQEQPAHDVERAEARADVAGPGAARSCRAC